MNLQEQAAKSLGGDNSYAIFATEIDSSLLNPMERCKSGVNRSPEMGGYDVWHAYEFTFLLNSGLPVSGLLKVVIPCNSEFMVESKSFKLYLNTFDMVRMGSSQDACKNASARVRDDLKKALKSKNIFTEFFQATEEIIYKKPRYSPILLDSLYGALKVFDFNSSTNYISVHKEHLVGGGWEFEKKNNFFFSSHLVRSRCRITKQKDTGSLFLFVTLKKDFVIDPKSILLQVCAMREKEEFHEFCCEDFYNKLSSIEGIENFTISFQYARRGGIDICPVRTNNWIDEAYFPIVDPFSLTEKTLIQ